MRSTLLLIIFMSFLGCQSQNNHNCPFPYQNHKKEDKCGYIKVPRNWNDKDSKTTSIGYLVIASKSKTKKSDPVIFLQGGPGGEVLNLSDVYSQLSIDSERDFILFDQRGIGFSEALCPDLSLELQRIMALDLSINEEIDELKKSIIDCKDFLNADNRQFSTNTNVKDLEALRKHLGYNKINLFGGSYGTRLGLKYMEEYPQNVRCSILSGLFPPEIRMYEYIFSNYFRALTKVFKSCKDDNKCNTIYPGIENEFLAIYNKLNIKPVTIQINKKPFVINQQDFLLLIHQMLYNSNLIDNIPSFIYSLKRKDYSNISALIKQLLPRLSAINLAVYYSVMTADEGGFENKKMLITDSNNTPIATNGLSLFSADPEIIESWPSKEIDVDFISKTVVNTPTLLISGDFDPVTPPGNAIKIQERLANSQHFIFDNEGHVPLNSCFFKIAKQFLDNPTQKLHAECHYNTSFSWN